MINEDSCTDVSLVGGFAAMDGNKSRSGADELIDADDLAGSSSRADRFVIFNAFVAPRETMSFAVGTAWARRGINIGKLAGYESTASKKAKDRKTEVTKTFVVRHEKRLFALCSNDVRVCGRNVGIGGGRKVNFNR